MLLLPEIWVLSMACVVLVLDLFLNDRSRVVSYWLAQFTLIGALALTLAVSSGESLVLMNGTFVIDPMSDAAKVLYLHDDLRRLPLCARLSAGPQAV